MDAGNSAAAAADTELVITRDFDAPRELMFRLWTDPAHMLQWLGPRDHPAVHVEMDARPGGAWRACLRPLDGGPDLWQGGVCREAVAPERIVFTFAWDKEHPAHSHETLVTVEFAEHGGKTRMTFRQSFLPSAEQRDGHREGWTSTFDRLADLASSMKGMAA